MDDKMQRLRSALSDRDVRSTLTSLMASVGERSRLERVQAAFKHHNTPSSGDLWACLAALDAMRPQR